MADIDVWVTTDFCTARRLAPTWRRDVQLMVNDLALPTPLRSWASGEVSVQRLFRSFESVSALSYPAKPASKAFARVKKKRASTDHGLGGTIVWNLVDAKGRKVFIAVRVTRDFCFVSLFLQQANMAHQLGLVTGWAAQKMFEIQFNKAVGAVVLQKELFIGFRLCESRYQSLNCQIPIDE